jgi:hypothetical protein
MSNNSEGFNTTINPAYTHDFSHVGPMRDAIPKGLVSEVREEDKPELLELADTLELTAAALRARCEGKPIECWLVDRWYPLNEWSSSFLTNPYTRLRPAVVEESEPEDEIEEQQTKFE